MHGDKQLLDIAESTTLPTAMRLFMLASAKSNYWGHSPFGSSEICDTLGISRQVRDKAFTSLKSARVIAPESSRLCVVLSAAIVRRADRTYKTCIEPKHVDRQKRVWVAGIGVGESRRRMGRAAERSRPGSDGSQTHHPQAAGDRRGRDSRRDTGSRRPVGVTGGIVAATFVDGTVKKSCTCKPFTSGNNPPKTLLRHY
jgi:hypothetical protein